VASVTVTHIPGTAYQTRIEGEESTLLADEPVASGGDGHGPSPYELLLAALAHCAVLTILLYARRKEWPVTGVSVRANHERLIIEDEREGEVLRRKVERIVQAITLDGDLDEPQRARLIEIAGKCPVHRTITGELEIIEIEAPAPVASDAFP
jgi:putative redox protein